jgi:hypothetical protein
MQWAMMALAFCALGDEQPDTVAVCPPSFLEALEPWIAYRTAQGHRVAVVPSSRSAADIRAAIRQHGQAGQLRAVLLVGDADPAAVRDPAVRARCTPTYMLRAKVSVRFGSEPELATDNWYADLDDDGVPDLAMGRITADTPAELARIVRKIQDYEQSPDQGLWRRQVHIVAGIGSFGTLADTVVEMAAKKFLTDGIPASYATTMTYGNWQSPYCPDPRLFHTATLQSLNAGGLFWVYIGDGQPRGLDEVRVPGGTFHILDATDAEWLRCFRGQPIAVLLACYTGAFDGRRDCLAEELLRAPGGPVAVLGGSRITMPYAMAVLSDALLDECFRQKRRTLGEIILRAKRRLAADDRDNPNRQLLDALAAAFSPSADALRDERVEHVALFNLLGDPLLRIRHPDELAVRTESSITAGGRLKIAVHGDYGGTGMLELVCRRDRLKTPPPDRSRFVPSEAFLRSLTDTYRAANDGVWLTHQVATDTGDFETELPVPDDTRGPCFVRVYLQGTDRFALGAAPVFVRRPEDETVAAKGSKIVK